ncbi:MAG: glutamine-hydrolyzing carbamoyl-phosphate synthase small subunit [Actinobacteria bacterium]|nr:glutamine-hydrolyzing carbamoyl-phosphate synthase small subunit [Actinomycetota bacterium]
MKQRPAKLALQDGSVYTGTAFGASGTATAEIVFNTSMAGYQEILTDPSYAGQIVTMTYPQIGNYGVNSEDVESDRICAQGLIVRELAGRVSNFRAEQSLGEYLAAEKVIGLEGIDTRALVKTLREKGVMNGVLSTEILDDKQLAKMAREAPGLVGRDLVREVSSKTQTQWSKGFESKFAMDRKPQPTGLKVVAIDCGIKRNILRNLVAAGFEVTVVPADTKAQQIQKLKPDGLFLSNGPGDPEPVKYTIETLRELIPTKLPIFGICLGMQLLGLALGGKTYKLKFGHRGANQPVLNVATGRVEITSQNHGFALDIDSLNRDEVQITHLNLNDKTLEGIAHRKWPIFAVQYHPEASPGPHDATYLFDCFVQMMQTHRAPNAREMDQTQKETKKLTTKNNPG